MTEQTEGIPGFSEAVLGSPRNPEQLVPAADLFPQLWAGEWDVCPAYHSQAIEENLPFLALPEQVNLGHEKHAETYRQAHYVSSQGTVYTGSWIRYAAAPVGESVTAGAASFLLFLTQPAVQVECAEHGFHPLNRFVWGE